MNQSKPLASVGVAANQYWQLIHVMLFNLKTIGYVFAVFFSIAVIAVALIIIFPSFYMLGMGVIFLSALIMALVGIMALPMGMLTLLSNKHLVTMADIRNKLFVIACIFCSLVSFSLSSSPFFIKNEVLSFGTVIYMFLSCSLYLGFSTYICSKGFELLFIAPLLMIVWVKFTFEFFLGLQPFALVLMVLLAWLLFYRWWISFSPKSSRAKSILVETDRRKMQEQLSVPNWFYFLSGRVKTPIGSLLLGYGDSVSSYFKQLVVIYSFSLLLSFFICGGVVDWQFSDSAFMAAMVALGYAFLVSVIGLPAKTMLMNTRRGWLNFSGDRLGLFVYLERQFFKGISVLVAFNLLLVAVLLLASQHQDYFIYSIGALLVLFILMVLMFYADIYFYKRGPFVPGDLNLLRAAVNLVGFIPLVCYLVFKYQRFNIFEVVDAVAIGLVLLVLGSLKIVRSQTIKKWQKADF